MFEDFGLALLRRARQTAVPLGDVLLVFVRTVTYFYLGANSCAPRNSENFVRDRTIGFRQILSTSFSSHWAGDAICSDTFYPADGRPETTKRTLFTLKGRSDFGGDFGSWGRRLLKQIGVGNKNKRFRKLCLVLHSMRPSPAFSCIPSLFVGAFDLRMHIPLL